MNNLELLILINSLEENIIRINLCWVLTKSIIDAFIEKSEPKPVPYSYLGC